MNVKALIANRRIIPTQLSIILVGTEMYGSCMSDISMLLWIAAYTAAQQKEAAAAGAAQQSFTHTFGMYTFYQGWLLLGLRSPRAAQPCMQRAVISRITAL